MVRNPRLPTALNDFLSQAPKGKRKRLCRFGDLALGQSAAVGSNTLRGIGGFKLPPEPLVSELRSRDFVSKLRSRKKPQISMFPGMICNLEPAIHHKLMRSDAMCQQPFSASKESRFYIVLSQKLDNRSLVASYFV